jgi:hypothetical protein
MQRYILTDQDDCTDQAGFKTEAIWRPKARDLRERRQRLLAKRLRRHGA